MTRVKIKRGDSGVSIEVRGAIFTQKYKSFDWHLSKRLTGALSSHFDKGIFSKGDVLFQESDGRRATAKVNFAELDWYDSSHSVDLLAAEIRLRVLRVKEALWQGAFNRTQEAEFIV